MDEATKKRIEEDLKKLPDSPGVYLMYAENQEILYIGKARNLKKRVRQYFRKGGDRSPKIGRMLGLVSWFEYVVTDSEVEALILENNLIKEHRPRYNTMLKDDKTYPYIKVTLSEEFPRLVYTRKIRRDKDKYYGPYPDASAAQDVIEFLNHAFKLRTCSRKLSGDTASVRPCLNFHIGRCDAPCAGNITKEAYAEKIRNACRFLDGTNTELIRELKEKMMEASEALEFEKAGEYRNLIQAAETISDRQKMEYGVKENRDVLGLAKEGFDAIMQVFFVRNGKLIGREHFYLTLAPEETVEETISSFIKQYYSGTPFLPAEILLPMQIEDLEPIGQWLERRAGRKVALLVPKKGQKEKLVELAERNAKMTLHQSRDKVKRQEARTKGAAKTLSELLDLPYARRMESYDISNISGTDSVGSMVVFEDGKPKKNDYRKFKIKTVEGPNDVASMKEVLARRLSHAENYPDLILIDGGKGQVGAVKEVMKELNLEIPVCGMVKDDRHRTRGLLFEGKEVELDASSEAFRLLTRIQDETHRFAIEYHRSLRSKGQTRSVLESIEGIGPKRRRALLKAFKSVDAIRQADIDTIASVDGMNRAAAEKVKAFFAD